MDDQRETIIPRHYCVAVYKKPNTHGVTKHENMHQWPNGASLLEIFPWYHHLNKLPNAQC